MNAKENERGFIFLELALGLPLVLALMWSLSHLFMMTWDNCRSLIADFTLQMEVNNAMLRITDEMRSASYVVYRTDRKLEIHSYLYRSNDSRIYESSEKHGGNDKLPIYYFRDAIVKNGKRRYSIYRQRSEDEIAKDHPITGDDVLSDVNVLKFVPFCDDPEQRLWHLTIEAESGVNGHVYKLQTSVYVGGADR